MSERPVKTAAVACDVPHVTRQATLTRMLTEQPHRLVRRVRSMTANTADAEDLAQEIVLRALRGIDALATSDEPLVCAWLDTIARNTAINAGRIARWRTDRNPLDSDLPTLPSAEHVAIGRITWRRMVTALRMLPPELAEVVRLRLIEDLPGPEVAHRLGLSEMAVRNRLHRARTLLRSATEDL